MKIFHDQNINLIKRNQLKNAKNANKCGKFELIKTLRIYNRK